MRKPVTAMTNHSAPTANRSKKISYITFSVPPEKYSTDICENVDMYRVER